MRAAWFICLIFILTGLLFGCAQQTPQMPDDFSLSFTWNNGSLPPEYRYDYVITIGPGAQGEFEYVSGYGDENDPNRWVTPFILSPEDMEVIYKYFSERSFFDAKWDVSNVEMVGGSTTSLILTAFGKEHRVPSIHKLEGSYLSKAKNAQAFICDFVPVTIWEEMEKRQQRYEAGAAD